MAACEGVDELPNLKIEIENNVEEPMETDDCRANIETEYLKDDMEEGEISDSRDTIEDVDPRPTVSTHTSRDIERRYENKAGGFVTGVDIFDEDERKKLDVRAKRFGLSPSESKALTEQQLKDLYASLGVKPAENVEKYYRLNAIHMRGTENMSTQDIFSYFRDYGPASVEWINDCSCNVVWLDEASAARALHGLSKQIQGLEAFHAKADPYRKEEKRQAANKESDKNDDIVVLDQIRSQDGEIIMVVDEVDAESDVHTPSEDVRVNTAQVSSNNEAKDTVNAVDITVPIPPGLWRKGADYPKAKCILLRFSTRADKKYRHAEKLSEYYKKHGNPNYGGVKGIITTSRKRRFQAIDMNEKKFDDDLGDYSSVRADLVQETNSKNPWGVLAKNWSTMDKSLLRRPRPYESESPPPSPDPPPRQVPPRHREQNDSSDNSSNGNNSPDRDDARWTRRSKVPRMRMYADEEQIRLERRRAISQQLTRRPRTRSPSPSDHSRSQDLRRRLVKARRAVTPDIITTSDLRSKLNLKKTLKLKARQKSPLRIEIDNDEYYKFLESDRM
ncbi:nuclear cap-binding protein subunit 3-like [Schistocerca cancellata]|uniref:nuclear cap-binding protein subunit 3-like n=1 Tax=Schistocerca cancellata TaxID=274614 RepID=UPI002117A008|nr:nuclear cap-binding protein subunit 3-like [Schistocerca cancellata]